MGYFFFCTSVNELELEGLGTLMAHSLMGAQTHGNPTPNSVRASGWSGKASLRGDRCDGDEGDGGGDSWEGALGRGCSLQQRLRVCPALSRTNQGCVEGLRQALGPNPTAPRGPWAEPGLSPREMGASADGRPQALSTSGDHACISVEPGAFWDFVIQLSQAQIQVSELSPKPQFKI